MNWYKTATLYDEIEKYGPKGGPRFPAKGTFPYAGGEQESLIQHIQNHLNISREEAERYIEVIPEMARRSYFVQNYSWSIPSEQAITKLKYFIGKDQVLSVGSGYGLWSKLLQDVGVNVTATTFIPESGDPHMPKKDHSFTDVENLNNIDATNKYSQANTLFMSWPPYNDLMALESLKNFGGNKVIFIGEGQGGCTGSDEFHNLLYNEWENVGSLDIPQWPDIYDNIELFHRK